jgi:GNAT superfamily N-acetyltransferase
MKIELRPAVTQDFEYCERLYFAGMKNIIEELNLDMAAQAISFRSQWALPQVRIISVDSSDVGWLKTTMDDDGLVAQLFVDGPSQRHGIGIEVMNHLIGEATALNQAVRLAVVKQILLCGFTNELASAELMRMIGNSPMKRDPDRTMSV